MLPSLLGISGYSCLVPKLSVPLMGTPAASVFPISRRQWSEEAMEVRDIQLLSKSYTAGPELGQARAELESPVGQQGQVYAKARYTGLWAQPGSGRGERTGQRAARQQGRELPSAH